MKSIPRSFDLVTSYTILDDFYALLQTDKQRGRRNTLNVSEVAVISLLRSYYGLRNWKCLYQLLTDRYVKEFSLPSYKSFVMSMNKYSVVLMQIVNMLLTVQLKLSGGLKIVDSTPIPVCKNMRISQHRVMKSIAKRSKTTTGWFYGLKLHIVSDVHGNILLLEVTPGDEGDREVLNRFLDELSNSVILADGGYVSMKLKYKAAQRGNILRFVPRKNMYVLTKIIDVYLQNLRPRVEVIFSVLKERMGLITSLPRSVNGYLSHYIHVLFGYMMSKSFS
jgi:hypothetical protein